MFQSVAPAPGKIDFEIEPFPIPDFQVLPEASKVTTLPVAEPVAVASPTAESLEEEAVISEKNSFPTEVEDEVIIVDEAVNPEGRSFRPFFRRSHFRRNRE